MGKSLNLNKYEKTAKNDDIWIYEELLIYHVDLKVFNVKKKKHTQVVILLVLFQLNHGGRPTFVGF